jgi:predicted RNase H-like HicB family nuclease
MQAAMRQARYESIEEDGVIFATIPGFDGLWATGKTHEEAESELASVLEGWLLVGLAHHHPLPIVDGIDLAVHAVA